MIGEARYLTQALLKWNLRILMIAATLALMTCIPNAAAQSGAGSIQGTVTDSMGAIIPRALIHVVNQATGVATDARSNSVGFYQVPELFTGNYSVTITVPDMKTYATSIQLLVAQSAVINAVMTPGSVTQQVQVSANTAQLTTTDNGTVTTTIESQQINQIPQNGRFLVNLVGTLAPGVEAGNGGGGGERANGLMSEALDYVADGVSLDSRDQGGMDNYQGQTPDFDAIQEVQVETNNTSAQYTEPGTVLITTKSGTNSIHGALFETARNNAVGIARARQNPSNYVAPHLVRNEFGASAGGPIVIPHLYHGKDKSFWFFAFERYSLADKSYDLESVPTMAMRQGDFSGLTNGSNVTQLAYDFRTTTANAACPLPSGSTSNNPYCRTPFANNQIPTSLLSPTIKVLNDITPLPDLSYNPIIQANLHAVDPDFDFVPTETFRLDQVFNEKNRAYLRYTQNHFTHQTLGYSYEPVSLAADGLPAGELGLGSFPDDMFATALGYTHVFSPTFYAETILGASWFQDHNGELVPQGNIEKDLGLPNNFGEFGWPQFGLSSLIEQFGGSQNLYGESQRLTTADENLTKVLGKHQMQFGGRYRFERFGYRVDQASDSITFGTQATGLYDVTTKTSYGNVTNTGNVNTDAFVGAAAVYGVKEQPPYAQFHDMEFDAYFQDNYRVRRDLTLNLGLRWEAHPAAWMANGQMVGFDLKNDAMVLSSPPAQLEAEGVTTQAIISNLGYIGAKLETPSEAGLPSQLVYNKDLNFSPRVGIAWQPFGGRHGTVLRGAYGRYIYPVPTRTTYRTVNAGYPYSGSYSQSYTSASQSPDGGSNYLLRVNQLPVVMGVNSANVVNTTSTTAINPGIAGTFLNPDLPPDFVTQTNFTIEQRLKGNSALRVTYAYTHGTNLDQAYYYNAHPSTFTWEVQTGTVLPTGGASVIGTPQQYTYSSTGTGPYDKTTWSGGGYEIQKSGWSNDNALQVNYQRLFHTGIAYQISYVWSKPFRVGGNWTRDGVVQNANTYGVSGVGSWQIVPGSVGTVGPYRMPPQPPAGIAPYAYWHALDRWMNYQVDTAIPKQHIKFNGIVDLPVGRGKRFLGNSPRWLDEIVGGFQVAGDGSIVSQDFSVASAADWGPVSPIQVFKHAKPITDCRSGVCQKDFYWFNGYFAPSAVSGSGCIKNCVTLPPGVTPFKQPIDTNYNPTVAGGTAADPNYNTDNVQTNLSNGKTDKQSFLPSGSQVAIAEDTSNPWAHQVVNGPFNWTADASIFKVFPIRERIALRVNADAFNAFNVQGYNNPDPTLGEEVMTSSYNTPRQLQFTIRLEF